MFVRLHTNDGILNFGVLGPEDNQVQIQVQSTGNGNLCESLNITRHADEWGAGLAMKINTPKILEISPHKIVIEGLLPPVSGTMKAPSVARLELVNE